MSPDVRAQASAPKGREALPGGGSVMLPSPYKANTRYPNYADREGRVRIGYRNWRSTMSGHPECDGMLAVGRSDAFADLRAFVQAARAGLSIQWSDASRIPGQPWDGDEKRYPLEEAQGDMGPELIQQLAVHRVGFFDVYDEPSHLYAVQHAAGVNIGVWLFDKHGGLKGARRIADRVAASFQP